MILKYKNIIKSFIHESESSTDLARVDDYCIASAKLPSCALLLNAILPTINHIHSILSQSQIKFGCIITVITMAKISIMHYSTSVFFLFFFLLLSLHFFYFFFITS